jgi:hypothetical protein
MSSLTTKTNKDFSKAVDSLEWDFIFSTLNIMGAIILL